MTEFGKVNFVFTGYRSRAFKFMNKHKLYKVLLWGRCPQRAGLVLSRREQRVNKSGKKHMHEFPAVFQMAPKKPNSARRWVCRVLLTNKKRVFNYIRGIGTQKYVCVFVTVNQKSQYCAGCSGVSKMPLVMVNEVDGTLVIMKASEIIKEVPLITLGFPRVNEDLFMISGFSTTGLVLLLKGRFWLDGGLSRATISVWCDSKANILYVSDVRKGHLYKAEVLLQMEIPMDLDRTYHYKIPLK